MTGNVFGKRSNYIKALYAELLNARTLYPGYKGAWSEKHQLAALAFYRDSHSGSAKFIEIGRLDDTAKIKSEESHVQSMHLANWSPIANDCWVLGGFHSSKVFRLNTVGPTAVWDAERPGTNSAGFAFPVTRRELTGLLEFGFKPIRSHQGDTTITFELPESAHEKVHKATLAQYAETTTLEKRSSRLVHDFMGEYITSS